MTLHTRYLRSSSIRHTVQIVTYPAIVQEALFTMKGSSIVKSISQDLIKSWEDMCRLIDALVSVHILLFKEYKLLIVLTVYSGVPLTRLYVC